MCRIATQSVRTLMNLRNIDLSLLAAFVALIEERSVSRAAERMFVTQPAMSYALNRLRSLLNDPLLVRSQQRMQPTARALTLVAPIRSALAEIERIFQPVKAFDPAHSERQFTIATSDYAETVIIAPLLQRLLPYPLSLRAGSLDTALDQPLRNTKVTVDIVLAHCASALNTPGWCGEIVLYDTAVCLQDSASQLSGEVGNLSLYLTRKHIAVAGSATLQDPIDNELLPSGARRRILHTVSRYESAVRAIQQTDLLLTCPRLLAPALLAGKERIAMVPAPAELAEYSLRMQWPVEAEHEPASLWLRSQIRHIAHSHRAPPCPTQVDTGSAAGSLAMPWIL